MAKFLEPVVLDCNALSPTAILAVPPLALYNARYPMATLLESYFEL